MEKNFVGKLHMVSGALKAQAVAAISGGHDVCPVTVEGLSEILFDLTQDLEQVLRARETSRSVAA